MLGDTPSSPRPSRRDFLRTQAALAGAAAAVGSLSIARSAHAAGSDVITMALVGCGGRGTGAALNAINNKAGAKIRLIAMADAFPDRLALSLRGILNHDEKAGINARAQKRMKKSVEELQAKATESVDVPAERQFIGLDAYKKAIESDAQYLLLVSPPGFRPDHFEAAVAAGKNIFMEKPIATDGPGLRRMLKANETAVSKGLIIGCGHHLRHEKKNKEVIARVHDGEIGKVQFIRVYFNSAGVWVRPRQEGQNEMEFQVSNWYYFTWAGGDHIVEQHVHDLDVGNWAMKDKHPVMAQGSGGRQVRIGPQYGEIFDHHSIEFTYDDGTKMFSQCRQQPGTWESFSQHIHGDKGVAHIDGQGSAELIVYGKDPVVWKRDDEGHQVEHTDLLTAWLSGKPYNELPKAADATMTAILGRMASYSGKEVAWEDGMASNIDLAPKQMSWDTEPKSKINPKTGLYPCAIPGLTPAT